MNNNQSEDLKSKVVRVLLIEDSRLAAQSVKNQLAKVESTRFSVEWVEHLTTAIERLEKGGVDVVLLDLNLPDSQGAETFTRTCSQAPQVPIVVLTGTDDENLALQAVHRGAQDYLVKGRTDEKTLSRAIRYAIERRRLLAELERHAQALHASEASFHSIVEKNIDGIIVVDREKVVRFVNPAAKTLLGRDREELQSRLSRVSLAAGEIAEIDAISNEGTEGLAEIRVVETEWEMEKAYLAMLRDITERKRLEQMKDQFVSAISHDLRTPLNAMKGYLDLLLDGAFGELSKEHAEALGTLAEVNTSMTELVNSFSDLDKLKGGRFVLSIEPLDLKDVVKEVLGEVMPLAKSKGLILSHRTSRDSFPIKSDRKILKQIVMNLVGNAIKFTDQGGVEVSVDSVEVNSGSGEEQTQVRVKDSGPGVEADHLEKIFEEFYQVDASGNDTSPGTGLGLSICKRLVELLGGEIAVESEVGKGTTFTVVLSQTIEN
jgi:signal transduction histidine kinase